MEEGSSEKAGVRPEEPSEANAAVTVEEVPISSVMNGTDDFSDTLAELKEQYESYRRKIQRKTY